MSPGWFSRADFRHAFVKRLDNTQSIFCGVCLALTKICSGKTALHLTASSFRGIFVADDEALLAQGEEDKAKSAERSRCEAIAAHYHHAKRRR